MNQTKMYREIFQEPEKLAACFSNNVESMRQCMAEVKERTPACVVIAARGTSCNAGKYAKYLIETTLGIPVCIAAPSVLTKYNGKLNLSNALVIGISQSGAAEDVCSLLDRGNENGALTISITNTEDSLMATHAKYHFNCSAEKEESLAATKTFVTQMQLLTMMVGLWADDAELLKRMEDLPRVAETVLKMAPQLKEIANRWRFIQECFILARGLAYPVALECEIKLQETSSIHSQAFSVTNFTHGPVAMVSRRAPILLMACDAATDDNVAAMLQRVNNEGAETVVITNKPEIAAMAHDAILLPKEFEGVTAVFAIATAIQLLACELSVTRGSSPDTPYGLTKVTVTK